MGDPALVLWCEPHCVTSTGHAEEGLRRLRCAISAGPALREMRKPAARLALHCYACGGAVSLELLSDVIACACERGPDLTPDGCPCGGRCRECDPDSARDEVLYG